MRQGYRSARANAQCSHSSNAANTAARRREYQEASRRYEAARAQYDAQVAQYKADYAKWQADVAACQAGDKTRCAKQP